MYHTVDRERAVALRKESVDRNVPEEVENYEEQVALRKESVDRNFITVTEDADWVRSLSARRAWIEMLYVIAVITEAQSVALRKESVDRNVRFNASYNSNWICRSPQGERG